MENSFQTTFYCRFNSESQTQAFAQELYHLLVPVTQQQCAIMYLIGDLGAGKSTFSRAFIRESGYQGNIPSPTYSVQETYQAPTDQIAIHHFDLYRISDFMDLQVLGIYDDFEKGNLFLVEWPQIMMEHFAPVLTMYLQTDEDNPDCRIMQLELNLPGVTDEQRANFAQGLTDLAAKFA